MLTQRLRIRACDLSAWQRSFSPSSFSTALLPHKKSTALPRYRAIVPGRRMRMRAYGQRAWLQP